MAVGGRGALWQSSCEVSTRSRDESLDAYQVTAPDIKSIYAAKIVNNRKDGKNVIDKSFYSTGPTVKVPANPQSPFEQNGCKAQVSA